MLTTISRVVLSLTIAATCSARPDDQAIFYGGESDSSCHNACTALKFALGPQTYFFNTPDSVSPPDLESSYFAVQQQEIIPACWFTPTTANDVSVAINIIREHSCHFAIKSGGHAPNERSSSADGGVTIDMKLFDRVDYLGDHGEGEITRVGTGGRWGDVYKKLDPLGKTVVGGRDPRVGVGGLLLGGGISFISRRYGWAVDNIRSYEVVLANGTIANINRASAPEIYWALRGGGNNFGIVTHFDLFTYPLNQPSGGYNFYLISDLSSRLTALALPPTPFTLTLTSILHKLARLINLGACKLGYCITIDQFLSAFLSILGKEQTDQDAQMFIAVGYVSDVDLYLTVTMPMYARPIANPPVFNEFRKFKHVYSTNRVANFSSFYHEVGSRYEAGFRQAWGALSIKPNKDLMSKIVDIFITETETIKHIKDVLPSIIFQPINEDEIAHMSKNGGNCLGIKDGDGPLIIFSYTIRYSNAEDEGAVNTAGTNLISASTKIAKEVNSHHRYIYQNYANVSQDVFAGYGEENHKRLKEVQRKWDPEGVFGKRLQPGYFKV